MDFNITHNQILTPFISLRSDYGFKRAFGNPKYRGVVIKFLRAALGDEINITKVEPHKMAYHDKEVLPREKGDKRIIYDVYFTLNVDPHHSSFKRHHILKDERDKEVVHHFILEMQNMYEPPFEDRMAYYLSKMVSSQGKAGWNYDLDPVILIGVTDFDFPHLTKQLVQEFELREKTTGESLTKKLRMLFYSLERIPDSWKKCKTEIERQLFIIKNMDKLDKNSEPYLSGDYEELFDAAESVQLAAEDVVLYSQSMSRLRSMEAGLEYRYEEGRVEGRAEGRAEAQSVIARNLKLLGIPISAIAESTGLPTEVIERL